MATIMKEVELDSELFKLLSKARTPQQRFAVTALMQRYGVCHANQLLREQVQPFNRELKEILTGNAPNPADSVLNPKIVEVKS